MIEIQLDAAPLLAAVGRMSGPAAYAAIIGPLEKAANDARARAVKGFTSAGIGRRLFGRNDSGAWKLITLSKFVQQGDSVVATLSAKGLAALQEEGGRIKPHIIRPKRAKMLAFVPAGGELVFAKIVHHPGATLPKVPALRPAAEGIIRDSLDEIGRNLAALWERAA